jgi:hypothetical protein
LAIAALALRRSPLPMKLLSLFACFILAAALRLPSAYAPPGVTQWEMIARAGGVRYWFFPALSFTWLLLYSAFGRGKGLKVISVVLLCLLCFGIALRWRRPAFDDLDYAAQVRRVDSAPVGAALSIPINPDGWQMLLTKRPGPGAR